jgi:hypothetical protein
MVLFESQTVVLPSVPAFGCWFTVINVTEGEFLSFLVGVNIVRGCLWYCLILGERR